MAAQKRTRGAVWTHAERTAFERQNEQQQTRTSQLDERMTDVEESMTGVQDRINDVKHVMAGVEKLATRVQDSVKNFRDRVRVVEEHVESDEERITGAEKRITSTEDDIADAKERFSSVEDRIAGAERRITGTEDDIADAEERFIFIEARITGAEKLVMGAEGDIARASAAVVTCQNVATQDQQQMRDLKVRVLALERKLQKATASLQDPAASSSAVSPVPQRIPVPAASSSAVSPVPQRIPVPAMSSLSADPPLMSGGASLEAPNPTNTPLVAQDLERSRSATPVGRRDQYLASLSTPRSAPTPVFSVPILNHTVPPRRDARFPAHVFKRRDANKGRRRDSMPTSMRVAKCNNQVKVKRATRYPLIKACLMTSLFTGTFVVAGVAAGASYWVWENVYHYESKYA